MWRGGKALAPRAAVALCLIHRTYVARVVRDASRNDWNGTLPGGLFRHTPLLKLMDFGHGSSASPGATRLTSLPADLLQYTPDLQTL